MDTMETEFDRLDQGKSGELMRMKITLVAIVSFANDARPSNAVGQEQVTPEQQNEQTVGAEEVKQLLLIVDFDRSGKISKQDWMKFMEAEFDRLDKGKNWKLDAREIAPPAMRESHFGDMGK
jgi:hypothetical protein